MAGASVSLPGEMPKALIAFSSVLSITPNKSAIKKEGDNACYFFFNLLFRIVRSVYDWLYLQC